MHKFFRALPKVLLGLSVCLLAEAQLVPNPPFTINRKITLAQANRGGRVDLDYDLTQWPVKSMVVTCYRYQGPQATSKVGEWTVPKGKGQQRLDFKKMPTSVYFFSCSLIDPEGKPMALEFRPVQLEYGGWSGRLRVEEAANKAATDPHAPLGSLPLQVDVEKQDWVFKVVPEALVVQPGAQATLTASLNSRPVAEQLEWHLEGPGKIMAVENFLCYYLADKKTSSGQRAVIRVFSPQHPQQMKQEIQVLITSEPIKTEAPTEPPKASE